MEKRQKSVDDAPDRLSELPDSLILEILSFLEMRDVVRTTLLSKRWTDLWTTIPCLYFNELGKNPVQTRNFINRVLLRWNGANIWKFKISFSTYNFHSSLSVDMDFWVRFATEKQVEELYLYLPLQTNPAYELPQCVYSCSSITQLLLTGCNLQIRRNVEWDQLKGLTLHGLCFGEDLINQVVSSSPRLESLDLLLTKSRDQNLSIKSSSLKCLTIMKYMLCKTAQFDPSMYAVLTISAPKLESLSISGAPYNECLLMDVLSLTDVTLGFQDIWDVAIGENLRQILPTIQHVDALALSLCCFKMLEVMRGKYWFSPFLNVKQLEFRGGDHPIKPNDIVSLVEIFPKVEKLLIDWTSDKYWYPSFLANLSSKQDIGEDSLAYEANLSSKQDIGEDSLAYEANDLKSFLMQLRAVEISWYSYKVATIFQFIKFLLKHATMVQKIVIRQSGGRVVEFEGLEELLSLLRSFPTIDLILCRS